MNFLHLIFNYLYTFDYIFLKYVDLYIYHNFTIEYVVNLTLLTNVFYVTFLYSLFILIEDEDVDIYVTVFIHTNLTVFVFDLFLYYKDIHLSWNVHYHLDIEVYFVVQNIFINVYSLYLFIILMYNIQVVDVFIIYFVDVIIFTFNDIYFIDFDMYL